VPELVNEDDEPHRKRDAEEHRRCANVPDGGIEGRIAAHRSTDEETEAQCAGHECQQEHDPHDVCAGGRWTGARRGCRHA
jgi:hypothetical protein